jgi:hypothetical protein
MGPDNISKQDKPKYRLEDLDVFEVSLVSKPANKRKFLMWKSADETEENSSADSSAVLKEDSNMSEEILKALEGEFADGEKLQATLKEAEVSEKGIEAATAIARILTAFKDELPENLPLFLGYPEPEPKVIEKEVEKIVEVEVEKKEKTEDEKKAEVLKGVEDPEARAEIEKIWESNKALAEKQADLEKTLKAEQEAKEIKEFVEKAEKAFEHLPAKAEEIGPALRMLKNAGDEQFALIERLLLAGNEAIMKAKEAAGGPGDDKPKATYTELVAKAEEMISKGEAKTVAQAITKMVTADPSLHEKYLAEA